MIKKKNREKAQVNDMAQALHDSRDYVLSRDYT